MIDNNNPKIEVGAWQRSQDKIRKVLKKSTDDWSKNKNSKLVVIRKEYKGKEKKK